DRGLDVGECIQSANLRRFPARFHRLLLADLARVGHLPVHRTNRPGAIKQIPGAYSCDIAAGRGGRRRKRETKFRERGFDIHSSPRFREEPRNVKPIFRTTDLRTQQCRPMWASALARAPKSARKRAAYTINSHLCTTPCICSVS